MNRRSGPFLLIILNKLHTFYPMFYPMLYKTVLKTEKIKCYKL